MSRAAGSEQTHGCEGAEGGEDGQVREATAGTG